MSSEFQEKLDTLDLIITVLREHEKSLDELIRKISTLSQHPELQLTAQPRGGRGLTLRLDQWWDFKARCSDVEVVAYRLDDAGLTLSAQAHGVTLVYAEPLPTRTLPVVAPDGLTIPATQRLACGLQVALARVDTVETNGRRAVVATYRVDPAQLTAWLAAELERSPSSLVEGVIE